MGIFFSLLLTKEDKWLHLVWISKNNLQISTEGHRHADKEVSS